MNAIFRASALLGLALMLAIAAGCTVRPMLASPPAGAEGQGSPALSSVTVAPVTTRHGQEVRNHLIFLLHGGAGEPASPRYRLDLSVTSRATSAVEIQSGNENEPTAGIVTVSVSYRLIEIEDGSLAARGTQQASASYDRPDQEFAVLRAERDAENRASREAAELVRLAIAQHLARLDVR